MPGTLTIVMEDDGMDSGCVSDILNECVAHGKVLSVRAVGPVEHGEDKGQIYDNDLMYFLEYLDNPNNGAIPGKC